MWPKYTMRFLAALNVGLATAKAVYGTDTGADFVASLAASLGTKYILYAGHFYEALL